MMTQEPARKWWDTAVEPVRAVLDLAYQRSEMTPEVHDRVLAAFAPAYADTIRDIADHLVAAEDFRSDEPREVLARYGIRHAIDPLAVCEAHADEHEADAMFDAQLVASVMRQQPVRVAS